MKTNIVEHMKKIDHMVSLMLLQKKNELKRVEIWLQEINGIIYYIDSNMNIYNTEDILKK